MRKEEVLIKQEEVCIEAGKTKEKFIKLDRPNTRLITYPEIRVCVNKIAENSKGKFYFISPFIGESTLKRLLDHVSNEVEIKGIVKTNEAYSVAHRVSTNVNKKILVRRRGRIHAKVLLNEKECIIGSFNISDEGLEKQEELGILTNDEHILLNVERFFERFWESSNEYEESPLKCPLSDGERTRFVSSVGNLPGILFEMMKQANENLVIVSPYLSTEAVRRVLSKVRRNIKVIVVTKLSAKDFAGLSELKALEILLEGGAEIWKNPLIHAKAIIVDNKYALVSSMNITNQSFWQDFEAGVYTEDSSVIASLNQFINRVKLHKISSQDILEVKRELEATAHKETMIPYERFGQLDKFSYPQHASHSMLRKISPIRLIIKNGRTGRYLTRCKILTDRRISLKLIVKNIGPLPLRDVRIEPLSEMIRIEELNYIEELPQRKETIFESIYWYSPREEGVYPIGFIIIYTDIDGTHEEIRIRNIPVIKSISPRKAILTCLISEIMKCLRENEGKVARETLYSSIKGRILQDIDFVLNNLPELRSELKDVSEGCLEDLYYKNLLSLGLKILERQGKIKVNNHVILTG